ncbi:25381_t:CDS:1, partial [Racocetra persica]
EDFNNMQVKVNNNINSKKLKYKHLAKKFKIESQLEKNLSID